jgi:ElaB/YqjD/DUF883 family membrane-anchored ribosome-binding protein
VENRDPIVSGTREQPIGDWGKSEGRDIADRSRQRDEEAKQGAKNYASESQEYVQGALQRTQEYVEDTVQKARDKMTEYREAGLERVKHDMAEYTRQEPMIALMIAAGAGLLLGLLASAGRR